MTQQTPMCLSVRPTCGSFSASHERPLSSAARGKQQLADISVDASAMLRVQQVLDAIYLSSKEGRRVACQIE